MSAVDKIREDAGPEDFGIPAEYSERARLYANWLTFGPAIAPPVAAGSVDTMQRYELAESQHGTGYMVHWDKELQEDVDGVWVKHADAIAWGAQQRESGWVAGRINGAKVFDKTESAVLAAAERLLRDAVMRAEKAEADLKARDFFVDVLNCQVKKAQGEADILFHRLNAANGHLAMARERIEELETEIKVLHRG